MELAASAAVLLAAVVGPIWLGLQMEKDDPADETPWQGAEPTGDPVPRRLTW